MANRPKDIFPTMEQSDGEWTAQFRALTDQEQIVYLGNLLEKMRGDMDAFGATPESLAQFEASLQEFRKAAEKEQIALRRVDQSKAALEKAADALLKTDAHTDRLKANN